MLTYLAIAARLRPRWVVWENVPGVLSSNRGRDFGSFLGGLAELGYGISYRVLDAQWCRTHGHPRAVPQRRRRVFVVGCLGDATAAATVLLKQQSVLRNSKTRGAAREEIAADAEGSVGTGCWWDGGNTSDTLTKCGANGAQRMPDKDNFGAVLQPIANTLGNRGLRSHTKLDGHGAYIPVMSMDEECNPGIEMIGPIIRGGGGGRHDCVAVPYTKAKRAQSDTDDETWVEGQVNPTLSLFDCGDVRATTIAIQGNLIGRDKGGPQGVGASTEGAMYTMTKADVHGVAQAMTVRRLTPRECERLQGFPDDYTLIPWRKKEAGDCPDGPRYKALGNSMAVNCMEWIGERIAAVEAGEDK